MQIEECVQYVLLQDRYVSLPGIGSFVREIRPAHLDAEGHLLPSTQRLRFSNDRKFDDEALLHYLCNHSTLSSQEVEKILHLWLETVRVRLEKGEAIYFQGVGTLQRSGKQLRLSGEGSNLRLSDSFFAALPLPKEKGIGRRKTRRTNLGVVALICGLVAGGGLVTTYFLASPHYLKKEKQEGSSSQAPAHDTLQEPKLPPLDTTQILQETQQILDSSHRQVNALRVQPEKKQNTVFFIVAGSFSSIENANKLEKELAAKGYHATVRKINGMFRVTLGKYYDKKSGIREMNKRRTELQNEALWLIETLTQE